MKRSTCLLYLSVIAVASAQAEELVSTLPEISRNLAQTSLREEGLLWKQDPEAGRVVFFIPEQILGTPDWFNLAIAPERRKDLEQHVAAPVPPPVDAFGHLRSECVFDHHTGIGEPSAKASPLPEVLRQQDVALVGRVLQIVPGWNFSYSHVSSMVELRVDEVFKDMKGWPREGERIFYEQKRGSIQVAGRRLCYLAPPGKETLRVEVGQTLFVVGGHVEEFDSRFLYGSTVWPVTADRIEPQPYTFVAKPREALKLSEVRNLY